MYRNYIFDLYGTLLNVQTDEEQPMLWQTMNSFYHTYGAEYTPEQLKNAYHRMIREEMEAQGRVYGQPCPEVNIKYVFQRLLDECTDKNPKGENVADRNEFVEMAARIFRTLSRVSVAAYPGTIETLKKLKEEGCRLFVLCNGQRFYALPEMKLCALTDFFDDIRISSDYGIRKPQKEFLERLMQEENLNPEETLLVGDSLSSDIALAAACGVRSVFLNRRGYTEGEISRRAEQLMPVWYRPEVVNEGGIEKILAFAKANMPEWLSSAVFYDIYPPGFKDSNGDGIGDLGGIISKLDYIRSLGVSAIHLGPIFDSPFRNGGYDIRDYCKVAERYGTLEDMQKLFAKAHARDMKVVMEIIANFTSDEHLWFLRSKQQAAEDEHYIWTDSVQRIPEGMMYACGISDRDGCVVTDTFTFQPALNFGFGKPKAKWQKKSTDASVQRNIEEFKDIMRFWLNLGCDGFVFYQADQLVRNDQECEYKHTAMIYRQLRAMLDEEYPDAVMMAEWNDPSSAIVHCGFHGDLYTNRKYSGYNTLLRDYETEGGDRSYFRSDAGGSISRFLKDYLPQYAVSRNRGYMIMPSGSTDMKRMSYTLSSEEMRLFMAFMFTMPSLPMIYYGDEIGMKQMNDAPDKEGSYGRNGQRTPMQWSYTPAESFSDAPEEQLYLPVDHSVNAPSAADRQGRDSIAVKLIRAMIALRNANPDLQGDAPFEVVYTSRSRGLFVYRRGSLLCALNPSVKPTVYKHEKPIADTLFTFGTFAVHEHETEIGAHTFAIFRLQE